MRINNKNNKKNMLHHIMNGLKQCLFLFMDDNNNNAHNNEFVMNFVNELFFSLTLKKFLF